MYNNININISKLNWLLFNIKFFEDIFLTERSDGYVQSFTEITPKLELNMTADIICNFSLLQDY
jgi:hypothetical protein